MVQIHWDDSVFWQNYDCRKNIRHRHSKLWRSWYRDILIRLRYYYSLNSNITKATTLIVTTYRHLPPWSENMLPVEGRGSFVLPFDLPELDLSFPCWAPISLRTNPVCGLIYPPGICMVGFIHPDIYINPRRNNPLISCVEKRANYGINNQIPPTKWSDRSHSRCPPFCLVVRIENEANLSLGWHLTFDFKFSNHVIH